MILVIRRRLNMSAEQLPDELVNQESPSWPTGGLEEVNGCPVCGDLLRHILYSGLRDQLFSCAPGEWMLHRCEACGSAYLDPRPSPETIHIAYKNYFTHLDSGIPIGGLNRLRKALGNGYLNHCYGTHEYPAIALGKWVTRLLPGRRALLDAEMRHLPRVSEGRRLLDLGCGNGKFLTLARSGGWDVLGVDPDPEAVVVARSRGLDVRLGGVEVLNSMADAFDMITLSHMLEHVHDPHSVLRSCYRLLKRDALIWIETPNLEALGHVRFGAHWRGLEPPRHLVLFTHSSLQQLLESIGFVDIQIQPWRPLCAMTFFASEAVVNGRNPWGHLKLTKQSRREVANAERQALHISKFREFITITAKKSI